MSERNQCDGCNRGLPVDANGIHHDGQVFGMACTKGRYAMSETKWTKGPWTLGDENNECCEVCAGEVTIDFDRFSRYGSGTLVISREEMVANAHLVIAAPQLYEALEKLVGCIMETRGPNANNALHAAKTALRLARGE